MVNKRGLRQVSFALLESHVVNVNLENAPIQPILVVLVWRGGDRFQRALDSIRDSEKYFKRIILSITSAPDSEDMKIAERYLQESAHLGEPSKAEIICTQTELPTMQHQAFWIDFLQKTSAKESDWIYWLAYDDELCPNAIGNLIEPSGSWPLATDTVYIGPWIVRHELPDTLWSKVRNPQHEDEVWTAFRSLDAPREKVLAWVEQQLLQPTYIQMSGSIAKFRQHQILVMNRPVKTGPMRIEMATCLAGRNRFVAEMPVATAIIYGRSNSDRSQYSTTTRREDLHLVKLMLCRLYRSPKDSLFALRMAFKFAFARFVLQMTRPEEEWRTKPKNC